MAKKIYHTRKKLGVTSIVVGFLIVVSGILAGIFFRVSPYAYASNTTYYVSKNGSDTNTGAQSAPFKTFKKAMSVLAPGDTLLVEGGTYTEPLDVTVSGSVSGVITIKSVPGQRAVLDGETYGGTTVSVAANRSYITLSGFEVKRGYECVLIRGSNVTIADFDVHDCKKFGYRLLGTSIIVEKSTCHDAVTENVNGTNCSGGWGACMRTGPGSANITIRDNKIYNNWGEGLIIGQAAGLKAYRNTVYDNFSQNIYIGNAYDVDVYQNMTYSTNPTYYRCGAHANCITASEETISAEWGARLHNIRVVNNIGYGCKTGLGYTYVEVPDNGCDTCVFAHNTMVNTNGIVIKAGVKNHVVIANNILQGGNISVPSGDIVQRSNIVGDPSFATTPGLTPDTYRLKNTSSAINAASAVPGVTDDFAGNIRDTTPDIGAYEYSGANPVPTAVVTTSPPTPTPTRVPTAAPTSTPIPTAQPQVTCPPTGATAGGMATMKVNVNSTANYKLWVNMMGKGDAANTLWVQLDNLYCAKVGDLAGMPSDAWTWVDYQDGVASNKIPSPLLASGMHTIKLIGNVSEPGVAVNRILFTKDTSCVPTGTGDTCIGVVSTPTPSAGVPTSIPSATPTIGIPNTTGINSWIFTPIADAFVNKNAPKVNYSNARNLQIDGSPVAIAYMAFDLGVLREKTITKAQLKVYVSNGTPVKSTQTIHIVDPLAWDAKKVTYQTRPVLKDAVGSIRGTVAKKWKVVDVTNAFVGKGGAKVSLGIDSSSSDGLDIVSMEGAYKPQIYIEYK